MSKSILLTGSTGYLGNRLGQRLLEEGFSVVAVHLNRNENFVFDEKYEARVHKVYLSEESVSEIFAKNRIDGIIHTSTLYGRSGEQIADMIKANVVFPVEIITNAITKGVEFFINTDSILNKYISPYALTKSNLTDWMKMYADDIKMIDIKLDHFYGPNDKNTKFVAAMLEKLVRNEEKIDLTEGTQTRDFIYIDDVVDVYAVVLKNLDKMSLGQVATFEVGTNKKTSIRYVVTKLKELVGSTTKLNFGAVPYRKNEMLDYDVNTTALRLLGWEPSITIEDGLKKVIADIKVYNSYEK